MKSLLLRFLYDRYRAFFYAFFVEEMLRDMPKEISEPSMGFLANGKEKMERWIFYWISLLQQRIITDEKLISEKTGMILMLKILRHTVASQTPARSETRVVEDKTDRPDHAAQLERTIKEFKQVRDNKSQEE